MKRTVTALLCAAAVLLVSACVPTAGVPGSAPTVNPHMVVIDGTEQPFRTPNPASADLAAQIQESPTPTPTATPDRYSRTTGLLLPPGQAYQPVLAVIGNAAATRPQTGLMQADVIYELPVDKTGNETRFMALFSDQYPARVGPVQSARTYFAAIQGEWSGMFVFDGYPSEAGYPPYRDEEALVPGMYSAALSRYFFRDETVSSLPENTLFCNLKEMAAALYGKYSPEIVPDRFLFEVDAQAPSSKPVQKIGLPFASKDWGKIEFVYNAQDNMFYRYERNSKGALVQSKTLTPAEEGAAFTSEPLRVRNLIVQYVRYDDLLGDYRDLLLTGTGACDFFFNGRYVPGFWKRTSLDAPTRYILRDGSPLVLEPGSTWIALQSGLREVRIRLSAQP